MGVIKNTFLKKHSQVTEPPASNSQLNDLDLTFEDNLNDESGMHDPPKRRIGRKIEVEPNEGEDETVISSISESVTSSVSPVKRIRLSADITKSLHRRLKLYSITSERSILAILESWIQQYTPE